MQSQLRILAFIAYRFTTDVNISLGVEKNIS